MARRVVLLAAAVLAVAGVAAPASAQGDPDRPFATLGRQLRPDDRVTVRGGDIGEVRGRLTAITGDALTVDTENGVRTIAARDVDRIDRRRKGILLGALIGLGAGAAAGAALNSWFRNEGNDAAGETAAVVAIGLGTGLAIDALVDLPRTVYVREGRAAVRLDPRALPGGAALRVHVSF